MFQEAWNQAVEFARFWVECFGKGCARYSGVISLFAYHCCRNTYTHYYGNRNPVSH